MTLGTRRRYALGVLALSLFTVHLWIFRRFFHDDAYISLRYARNLIEGEGLVFNPGERVEGYTNFLWILLVALPGFLGVDLVVAARVLGCLFSFGTLLLLLGASRPRAERGHPLPGLGAVLLACNASFALWTWGGLETSGVGFFLTATFLLVRPMGAQEERSFSRGAFAGLTGAAAICTRPDSLLVVTGLFGVALLDGFGGWRRSRSESGGSIFTGLRASLGFAAVAGGLLTVFAVWKLSYYGSLIPNTFYAKTGDHPFKFEQGGQYLRLFGTVFGWPFLFLPTLLLRRGFRGTRAVLLLTLIGFGAYVLRVGGDHMVGFRFFVPVLPILFALLEESLSPLHGSDAVGRGLARDREASRSFSGERALFHVAGCLLVLYFGAASLRYFSGARDRDPAAFWGAQVGKWIGENWPENSLVALNSAGATPYFSRMPIVDMLGLVDPVISRREIRGLRLWRQRLPGHLKGDGGYVLDRKPDYMILGPAGGCNPASGEVEPWYLSDLEILESPSFASEYRKKTVWIPLDLDELQRLVPRHERIDKMRFVYFERVGKKETGG